MIEREWRSFPDTEEGKTAYNARVIAFAEEYKRSRTPEQKMEAAARMEVVGKIAREGMRKTLAAEKERKEAQERAPTG